MEVTDQMKGEENVKPESGKLTVKISGVDQFLTVVRHSRFEHKILKWSKKGGDKSLGDQGTSPLGFWVSDLR